MPFIVVMPGENAINRKYNKFCEKACLKQMKNGKLQCHCGEDCSITNWHWEEDKSSNLLFANEREVQFHPFYSSGTAAVKGTSALGQNMHHYWEIKMITKLYGTDVMVGVATSKIEYENWKLNFCSMLGIDSNSYGYSYRGFLQHNKKRVRYGPKFGLGSIVGVHLDMCSGTMEYFLNRQPLGIAFRNLKNKELFPMVSSTAAQSAIRITCCVSQEPTLQIMCLKVIMNNSTLHNRYRKITGLTKIYDRDYFWIQPYKNKPTECGKLARFHERVAVDMYVKRPLGKRKRNTYDLSNLIESSTSSSDDENIKKVKTLMDKFYGKLLNSSDTETSSDEEDTNDSDKESDSSDDDDINTKIQKIPDKSTESQKK